MCLAPQGAHQKSYPFWNAVKAQNGLDVRCKMVQAPERIVLNRGADDDEGELLAVLVSHGTLSI